MIDKLTEGHEYSKMKSHYMHPATAFISLVISLVFATATPRAMAKGEEPIIIPVAVITNLEPNDKIGTQVEFALKELVRNRSDLKLVHNEEQARVRVAIVSTRLPPPYDESVTVLAVAWTGQLKKGAWLYDQHVVRICGINTVDPCAKDLMMTTDKTVELWREALRQSATRSLSEGE